MGRKKKTSKAKDSDEAEEKESRPKFNIASDAKRSVVAVFLLALALVIILGFFNKAGVAGDWLDKFTGSLIGWAKLIAPIFLVIAGIVLLRRKETAFYVTKIIGLTVMLVSITGFLHWFYDVEKMLDYAKDGLGGGYAGYAVAYLAVKFLGSAGGLVIIIALFLMGIIVAFNFSILHFFENMLKKEEKENLSEEIPAPEGELIDKVKEAGGDALHSDADEEVIKKTEEIKNEAQEDNEHNIGKIEFVEGPDQYVDEGLMSGIERHEFAIKSGVKKRNPFGNGRGANFENKEWILPPTDLLEKSKGGAESGDTERNAEIIEKTFKSFGIEVERGGIQIGPSVTQYSFKPAVGIKVSKILELNSNLAMALAKHPIRIEAPIPGKSLIGVEVPNNVPATVRLRNLIESSYFKEKSSKSSLTLALGEDVSGEYIMADLGKMPHLLIAGATGTGKSVGINSIITTLLYQNSPEDLKFIMIDPKRVELSLYNGIPHLLSSVVIENGKVINALKWVVGEMERRYRLLQDMKSQNVESYNEKRANGQKKKYTEPETKKTIEEPMEKLPYIVVVVDELAELMMSHGKEVEGAIVRIAQLARAVGIHLVISTQRPEVRVITGLIKANINARIAFKVNTQVDSRTILDMAGAEKLLGGGDMLFLSAFTPKTKRVQGIFVSEMEVKKVVKFIKDQQEKRNKIHGEKINEGDEIGIGEDITVPVFGNTAPLNFDMAAGEKDDELYEAAKEEVIRAGKGSASLLQRRLRVGYSRAARLLDILEEKGIIGPSDGAKPREVYADKSAANPPAGGTPQEAINYDSSIEDQTVRDKWQM